MSKSPNLATCTAKEWADWVLEAKREQGVVMYSDTFLTASQLNKITEAYRIVGQREGYKKGKRDGSRAGYRVGYDKGYERAEWLYGDDDWTEREWYE